jgi:hypothetical protein
MEFQDTSGCVVMMVSASFVSGVSGVSMFVSVTEQHHAVKMRVKTLADILVDVTLENSIMQDLCY